MKVTIQKKAQPPPVPRAGITGGTTQKGYQPKPALDPAKMKGAAAAVGKMMAPSRAAVGTRGLTPETKAKLSANMKSAAGGLGKIMGSGGVKPPMPAARQNFAGALKSATGAMKGAMAAPKVPQMRRKLGKRGA